MDEAVLDAYGWNDIALKHDFYEVDYLPENDRVRFTIHPDARKEVLKRLLELNHKIHAEEVAQGLHNKKSYSEKQKGVKRKEGLKLAAEPESIYRQSRLFEEPNLFSQSTEEEAPNVKVIGKGSKVLLKPNDKEEKWMVIDSQVSGLQTLHLESGLTQRLLGKKAGDRIDFGNGFEILEVE